MTTRILGVETLEKAGFNRIGAWTLRESLLHCDDDIPKRKGVYAFALNGQVIYVGLASRSLAQRLNFYRKPGPTQATNIRLNKLLVDCLASDCVDIYVAMPEDGTWNGLPVSTAEGLEAGLIAKYDLPWNKRGQSAAPKSILPSNPTRSSKLPLVRRVLDLIARRSNLTEAEIAQILFGAKGYQQKVNPVCRQLVAIGRVERHGGGGPGDPFTYRVSAACRPTGPKSSARMSNMEDNRPM